jgi:hypothetical protein
VSDTRLMTVTDHAGAAPIVNVRPPRPENLPGQFRASLRSCSGWDRYALSAPVIAPPRRRASRRCRHPPGETRELAPRRGRLESVGTCGLGLSRFVSAGVVLGTDLVYLSATVRGYGEPAHFRPGGVVDPDTGRLAGPGGADLD